MWDAARDSPVITIPLLVLYSGWNLAQAVNVPAEATTIHVAIGIIPSTLAVYVAYKQANAMIRYRREKLDMERENRRQKIELERERMRLEYCLRKAKAEGMDLDIDREITEENILDS